MRWMLVLPLGILVSLAASGVEVRVAGFNIGAHFTYDVEGRYYPDFSLGAPGTTDHDSVRDILGRIHADVVALEEVHVADVAAGHVAALAADLGYPHVLVAPTGNAFDPRLQVAILSRFPFLHTSVIQSPPGARDMNRLIPTVTVDVPGTDRDLVVVAAHLKSGSSASDMFQRVVELRRITDFLAAKGLTSADNFLITGDFNLSSNGRTFAAPPATGLPGNFSLGPDITMPITYSTDPAFYFGSPAAVRMVPRQVDGSTVTFPTSGSMIDVFLTSATMAERPVGTEVYNSALDAAEGGGLAKSGLPLAVGTSSAASDHLAIFGDFELDPPLPYEIFVSGDSVSESFDGISGTFSPYPWAAVGGPWLGTDDGSSGVPGFRAYRSETGGALGFVAGETAGSAVANFANRTAVPLTAMEISYRAGQWRSAHGGSADVLSADLIIDGIVQSLSALTFAADTGLPGGEITGGSGAVRSTVVCGLEILPGEEFQLRFTFTPGPGGGLPPADVFLNEFSYDNLGADTGEFVEIVVGPGFAGPLTAVELVLYNGSNGATYGGAHKLSGFTKGATTPSGHRIFSKLINGIQNGEPDGMALVVNGVVTEFISYEGAFTASNGPAVGLTSVDIGVGQTGNEPEGSGALGRTGSGGSGADFTWVQFSSEPHTAGSSNPGQTLVLIALPPQGMAIDDVVVTAVASGDTDGDGSSDAEELIFRTDPSDAKSRFAATLTAPTGGGVALTFPTHLTRDYAVETSGSLVTWAELIAFPGTGEMAEVLVDPTPAPRFFRVRVTAP